MIIIMSLYSRYLLFRMCAKAKIRTIQKVKHDITFKWKNLKSEITLKMMERNDNTPLHKQDR